MKSKTDKPASSTASTFEWPTAGNLSPAEYVAQFAQSNATRGRGAWILEVAPYGDVDNFNNALENNKQGYLPNIYLLVVESETRRVLAVYFNGKKMNKAAGL